jgi:predicted nucleotidyltransferase
MNLLAELLSSKARAEIFRILFGTDDAALYLRELERRSGFSAGTVQQELKRLHRLDLIGQHRDGNRLYYHANREHPLFPEIRNMVLKTVGLADLLGETLRKSPGIRIAFIFGPLARDEEKAQSAVDLMIVGDDGPGRVAALLSSLFDRTGREIRPRVLTEDEFRKRREEREHLVSRALLEPKRFVIGNEEDLRSL